MDLDNTTGCCCGSGSCPPPPPLKGVAHGDTSGDGDLKTPNKIFLGVILRVLLGTLVLSPTMMTRGPPILEIYAFPLMELRMYV